MAFDALPSFVRPTAAPMKKIETLEPRLPAFVRHFELAAKGFETSLGALDTDFMRRLNACSGTQIHVEKIFGAQAIPTSQELSNEYQARKHGAGTTKNFAGYIIERAAIFRSPKSSLHSPWVGKGRRRPY